jgi:hypothetical protein
MRIYVLQAPNSYDAPWGGCFAVFEIARDERVEVSEGRHFFCDDCWKSTKIATIAS